MKQFLVYGLFVPSSEVPVGYMVSDVYPTFEMMGDKLAELLGFDDRDGLLLANPGIAIAALALQ
jgi:hypothetical protein